jgi:protocatechuate 3,4-dioxygenase beta subunit
MSNCARAGMVVLALACGSIGCDGGNGASLTAPTPATTGAANPPTGDILMKGTVSDTASRDLPGAKVEVVSGPSAGLSTIADTHGEFALVGRFDETTRFQASSAGHVTAVRTLQPFCLRCNPAWWINFTLDVLEPAVDVAGA